MSELDDLFNELLESGKEKARKEKEEESRVKAKEVAREERVSESKEETKKEERKEKVKQVQVKPEPQPKSPQPEPPKETIHIRTLRPEPTAMLKEDEFDFAEVEEPTPKEVYLIYGHKGHGKTYLAMTFPGTIVILSFDRKSALVKAQHFRGQKRIKVFDVVKYLDYSTPERWLETAEKTFRYLNALLDYIAEKIQPDWIVIDGAEIFQQICEMTMRYRNNLMPFQGVKNLNLWKERRLYIRQIHNKALSIAKKGLIYTTYVDKDEIVIDGELVAKKDVPRWIDAIMYETDTVIRVRSIAADGAEGLGGRKFIAIVESSKWVKGGHYR